MIKKFQANKQVVFPKSVKTSPGGRIFILEDGESADLDDSHRYVRRLQKVGDISLAGNTKPTKTKKD